MAQKTITELQLIDAIEGTESFPVDDSIQTYRATPSQLASYILPDGGLSLAKLSEALIQHLAPTGKIDAYGGDTAPSGWLICDGSAVSRATYSALWDVIGTNFGQGDGSTTFNLPDLRGRFLRGVADGSSNDPDRAARTAMNTGGNTGDNVGSVQADGFGSHGHTQNAHTHRMFNGTATGASDTPVSGSQTTAIRFNATGWTHEYIMKQGSGSPSHGQTSSVTPTNNNTGGSETRPVNAYVHWIIKT